MNSLTCMNDFPSHIHVLQQGPSLDDQPSKTKHMRHKKRLCKLMMPMIHESYKHQKISKVIKLQQKKGNKSQKEEASSG